MSFDQRYLSVEADPSTPPEGRIPLSSLPTKTVRKLVSLIEDPEMHAEGMAFLDKKERAAKAKLRAARRTKKAARRHNRRS